MRTKKPDDRWRQPSEWKAAAIIGNELLAAAIHRSIDAALSSDVVRLGGRRMVSSVFERSLNAAIRDIEQHPRGKLFQRLIKYGTPEPDAPKVLSSDGETTLSDPECGLCVDFIHWQMISRFKGELAELLALEPCVQLVKQLQEEGRVPLDTHLYWGPLVQERRRVPSVGDQPGQRWGGISKGADGLLVRVDAGKSHRSGVLVHGIVEVKSMPRSSKLIFDQIERHRSRLAGGVSLGSRTWSPDRVRSGDGLIRIAVVPSRWTQSRAWRSVRLDARTRAIVPEGTRGPTTDNLMERLGPNDWRITLAWSHEALTEAAYEMTVWYMAQVGARVFAGQRLPRGLETMTPEETGVNQIKYRLYVIGLRYISRRQERLAMRIYNAYAYGSPLARDRKAEMIWPDDVANEDAKAGDEAGENAPPPSWPDWRMRKIFSSRSDQGKGPSRA